MGIHAVITADIVNSTLLKQTTEKKLLARLTNVLKGEKFEFYRGDSFQVYCRKPAIALTLVLKSRLLARSLSVFHDVRASIGIAEIRGTVYSLRTAKGEAFTLSGRAFEKLDNEKRLTIISKDDKINSSYRMIGHFIDYLFTSLTAKQAEIIYEILDTDSGTQADVARKLRKSQVTIHKQLRAAGWYYLERILIEYDFITSEYFK